MRLNMAVFKLPFKYRARRDYVAFRARAYWPFYLSVVGLVLTVIGMIAEPVAGRTVRILVAFAIGAAFIVGIVKFWDDWRSHRRARHKFDFLARTTPPEGDLPSSYPDAVKVTHPRLGAAVVVDPKNLAQFENMPFGWNPDAYAIVTELREASVEILQMRLKHRAITYNGPTVRQITDITPAAIASNSDVLFQPATYFDDECSNKFVGRFAVRRRDRSEESDDLVNGLMLDTGGRLRELASSRLANAVGVSTLAFTSDLKLVVVLQSSQSGESKSLYAPSGSGSLEPLDREGHTSIGGFVAAGMEREFREECNLPTSALLQTHLTGWARWMGRAGKPEFLGVTRLGDISSEDVTALKVNRRETVFTERFECVDVDLSALAGMDPLESLNEIPGIPRAYADHASMPLVLALRALGISLGRPDSPISELLKSDAGR
jgi:hypothetical protein